MAPAGSSRRAWGWLWGFLPALAAAGLVQAAILWCAGWRGDALLLTPGIWVALVGAGVAVARGGAEVLLYQSKLEKSLVRNVAIVGYDDQAVTVARRINADHRHGFKAVGIFGDRGYDGRRTGPEGSLLDLMDLCRRTRLDAIVIALPPGQDREREIAALVWQLRSVAADVLVAPYLVHGASLLLPVQAVGPLWFNVLQRRPLSDAQAMCKWAFDYAVALLALVPLLIFFLIVAILIRADSPGPIFFRQPRLGLNNRQFTVFKFRTMHASQTDLLAARQTSRGDQRVTRVGKWLRRLSIDEMPQIFNVLRGEMSLVGPRPHAPQTRIEGALLDEVLVEYIMRYRVKPGITGWAQVNGARGQLMKPDDLRKRVHYDLEYIARWSLLLDVKILVLTVLREVVSKHAY